MNNMICCQNLHDEYDIEVEVVPGEETQDLDDDRFVIYIGPYEFEGPYNSPDQIEERAGVYSVLCFYDKQYELLDIGYSTNVRQSLLNHKDHDKWMEQCTGSLLAAVHYDDAITEGEAGTMIAAIECEHSLSAA